MKKLIILKPRNNKGFRFIKNNGSIHEAKQKGNKLIVKAKKIKIKICEKDKRFEVSNLNERSDNLFIDYTD